MNQDTTLLNEVKDIIYTRLDECRTDAVFPHFIRLLPDGTGLVHLFGDPHECCTVVQTAGYEILDFERHDGGDQIVWFSWNVDAEQAARHE